MSTTELSALIDLLGQCCVLLLTFGALVGLCVLFIGFIICVFKAVLGHY